MSLSAYHVVKGTVSIAHQTGCWSSIVPKAHPVRTAARFQSARVADGSENLPGKLFIRSGSAPLPLTGCREETECVFVSGIPDALLNHFPVTDEIEG